MELFERLRWCVQWSLPSVNEGTAGAVMVTVMVTVWVSVILVPVTMRVNV